MNLKRLIGGHMQIKVTPKITVHSSAKMKKHEVTPIKAIGKIYKVGPIAQKRSVLGRKRPMRSTTAVYSKMYNQEKQDIERSMKVLEAFEHRQ